LIDGAYQWGELVGRQDQRPPRVRSCHSPVPVTRPAGPLPWNLKTPLASTLPAKLKGSMVPIVKTPEKSGSGGSWKLMFSSTGPRMFGSPTLWKKPGSGQVTPETSGSVRGRCPEEGMCTL
jgi:hypothetical protein